MKLTQPKWIIKRSFSLEENMKTRIKYIVDDFYPYISHKMIRHHHDVTDIGTSIISSHNIYSQNFSWEANFIHQLNGITHHYIV
jgi:hypothetical protein